MDAQQIADAVERVQRERNELRDLIVSVLGSVLEELPGGDAIAHLPAAVIAEIRSHLGL